MLLILKSHLDNDETSKIIDKFFKNVSQSFQVLFCLMTLKFDDGILYC